MKPKNSLCLIFLVTFSVCLARTFAITVESGGRMVDVEDDDDIHTAISSAPATVTELGNWFTENEIIFSKVQFRIDKKMGYGLFATEKIQKDDILITSPLVNTFSPHFLEDSPLSEEITRLFEKDKMDDTTAIAFHLLHEKSHSRDSFFYPWLSWLPKTIDTPLSWVEEDFQELQTGEDFQVQVVSLKAHLNDLFQRYVPGIEKLKIMHNSKISFVDFQNAYLTSLSRGMSVKKSTGDIVYGIVPGFDFVNHGFGVNTRIEIDFVERDQGTIYLVADRDFKKGEQIFRNYMDLPNHQLLIRYGFTVLDNPFDYVPVFLDKVIANTQLPSRRKSILKKYNLDADFTEFHLLDSTQTGFDPKLLAALRVIFASPQELKHLETVSEKEKRLACESQELSLSNEIDLLHFLGELIIEARDHHVTSMENDLAIIRDGHPSKLRLYFAAIYRYGIKKQYDKALELVIDKRQHYLQKRSEEEFLKRNPEKPTLSTPTSPKSNSKPSSKSSHSSGSDSTSIPDDGSATAAAAKLAAKLEEQKRYSKANTKKGTRKQEL